MAGIETNERIPDRLVVPARYRKKYPGSAFRWCSETMINRKGDRGWVPCEKDEDDPLHKHNPDTRIKNGDVFLCHMPQELAAGHEAGKRVKRDQRMKAVRSQAAAAAASKRYLAQLGSKPTSSTNYQGAMPTSDFQIGYRDQGLNDKPDRDPVEARRRAQDAAEEAVQDWEAAGLPDLTKDPKPKDE